MIALKKQNLQFQNDAVPVVSESKEFHNNSAEESQKIDYFTE